MAKRKPATKPHAKPKRARAPAPAPAPSSAPAPTSASAQAKGEWRKTAALRVRMYRHGLGDCFLLSFPRAGDRDYRILVDCGVILGTPNGDAVIRQVVEDLKAETVENGKPTVDVLVATHEHWDHLSGFATCQDEFAKFEIGQAWLAWTEDPNDKIANGLRKERNAKLNALRLGLAHMRQQLTAGGALGADGNTGPAAADYRRAAEVLTFFGIDPDDPAPIAGLGAAAKGGKLGIADAMAWCRDKAAADRKFWRPGDLIEPKEVKGLRVYVLGPPTDRTQLFKDLPTKAGHETYGLAADAIRRAAAQAFFGADVGLGEADRSRSEFDRAVPFAPKYRIPVAEAAATEFFRSHYFGSGPDDADAWRRIDGNGLDGAGEFALQLDSDTNNTSLALAFELPDGRVLLFPGDAQVGNWESWHNLGDGVTKRTWKVDGKEVTAENLLNRTVLYKVGHHGSHNATLRGKGLEMMTNEQLVAMVPVDTYIAHEKKHWNKMPFDPLMAALKEHTRGRLILADQAMADMPTPLPADQAADAGQAITVGGPNGKDVVRPLYVDYFVPGAK